MSPSDIAMGGDKAEVGASSQPEPAQAQDLGPTRARSKKEGKGRSKPPKPAAPPAAMPAGVEGFNLVEDPWIPLSNNTLASLADVFSLECPPVQLAGNPVEKVAVLKLLLAIAMDAMLPDDDAQWRELGPEGVSKAALDYLGVHRDKFNLTGPDPFLQMPSIAAAQVASWAELSPQYASGNTTLLTQWHQARPPTAAQVAMLLVVLSPFALGGKKTDNAVVLTPGYKGKLNASGKPGSGRAGPSVAFMGLLHSFMWADTVLATIWLNMLTKDDLVMQSSIFPKGLGVPPWRLMPQGEDDQIARDLRDSFMGRLVPLSRFCLLHPEGLHYSEGLPHRSYIDGVIDPSGAMDTKGKKNTALWVNPNRRPWRELPALLSFLDAQGGNGFKCFGLDRSISRIHRQSRINQVGVWSGGMRVSSEFGEQYVSVSDDFVESCLWLDTHAIDQLWFSLFSAQMTDLDALSKKLYGALKRYNTILSREADEQVAQATAMFWYLAEQHAQGLIDACMGINARAHEDRTAGARGLSWCRSAFADAVETVYDRFCPNVTARQIEAWARARPDLSQYRYQSRVEQILKAHSIAPSSISIAPSTLHSESFDGQ